MSLPLRISFEEKDYTYTVLTKGINKDTLEIKINISGVDFTLIRNPQNQWCAAETLMENPPGLLNAIVRNISLRYRL